jgi:hypothetical protein
MALQIKSTRDIANFQHINAIIYGQSGIGKTVLCATAPKPLIVDAEAGLLSLANSDVDSVHVKNLSDIKEVYKFLTKGEHEYESVCIDSLSEVAEQILIEYKAVERDPRAAYGKMADEIFAIVRSFKNLPLHTFFVTKQTKVIDEFLGKTSFGPSYPGKQLEQNLQYQIDLVLAMRIGQKDGKKFRYLQTQPDVQYDAKDRSGKLDAKERPDLAALIGKIQAGKPQKSVDNQDTDSSNGES